MLPVLLAADIIGSVAGWLEEILGQNGRYLDRFALRGSALPRLERGIRQPWVDRVVEESELDGVLDRLAAR
jgi:hypothetical protein